MTWTFANKYLFTRCFLFVVVSPLRHLRHSKAEERICKAIFFEGERKALQRELWKHVSRDHKWEWFPCRTLARQSGFSQLWVTTRFGLFMSMSFTDNAGLFDWVHVGDLLWLLRRLIVTSYEALSVSLPHGNLITFPRTIWKTRFFFYFSFPKMTNDESAQDTWWKFSRPLRTKNCGLCQEISYSIGLYK